MRIVIAVGLVILVLLALAVAVWGLSAERGEADWESADRAWYKTGGDVVQALSLEVRQRARGVTRNAPRARPRSSHGRDRGPARVTARRRP
jgi:Na+-transporting methylmalonyl-CoA/oxaloacetate decarboxylase gamma subunit